MFARLVGEEMAELSDASFLTTAHEGAAMTVLPGTFSPRCGDHESLNDTGAITNVTVDVEGVPYDAFE